MTAHVMRNEARNEGPAPARVRAESLVLNNEIFLYGVIDPWEVRAIDVITALAELRHLDTITVRMNTPGGSVYEGLAIYDALRMSGRKIIVRVDALAGSIGSVIAMAGDEIVMAEDARIMIHNPWSYAQGESEDLRKLADQLDDMRDRLVEIYQRKATNLTRDKLIALMDAETWFTADEAIEIGLASRIDQPAKAKAITADAIQNRTIDYFLAPASTEKPASSSIAADAANPGAYMPQNQTISQPNASAPVDPVAQARAQVAEIFNACAPLGAEAHTRAADMVARGLMPDQARAEVIGILADRQPPHQFNRYADNARNNVDAPHPDRVIVDALHATMSGRRPEGLAAQYAGYSILDLGAAWLQARGEKVPVGKDRLVNRLMSPSGSFMNTAISGMHTTSDFPILLQEAGNRVLLDGYQGAQSALKTMARRRTATDFRELISVRLGDPGLLEEVIEGAEITHTTQAEAGESFALKTYARMLAISRQAIVNDNLGAFADALSKFGRSSATTEANLIAGLFTANGGKGAKLSDDVPLFDASRGNVGTAADLSIESLGKARSVLRFTKDLDGVTVLNLTPAYLVVGPELETEAEAILSQINAAKVDDANPFAGKLELLVEPRITDRSWRVFASTASAPILAIAYLNGNEGPILDTQEGWHVLGTEFRAILDFGCGLTDWRGAYLNPGL